MTLQKGDILVEIADEDLPKLAALYEREAPWAPHMVGLIHNTMKWRKSEKYKNYVKLMSPNNCWEEDGTIIATITCFNQDVFLFTLDDQCVNLFKGLEEIGRLRYDQRILLCAIHEKHLGVVQKFIEERKIAFTATIPNFFYARSPEEARNFTIECPPDVYIKKLEPSAAKQINEVWPHKFTNSEKYIAAYIEMNGGYGVFLKSNDEMVAWILKHFFSHLGMLQTEEKHKRKGYASLITKVLSKEIAEEGHWPLGTILQVNKNSIRMFEKLGFKNIGSCAFIFKE